VENKKGKLVSELPSQKILLGDEKRLIDVINYEKWRDDGKYEHQKRNIEKKQKKINAIIKAKKLNVLIENSENKKQSGNAKLENEECK
jgi:hypothetical protein